MSTADKGLTVRTAEQVGSLDRPTEDRIFLTDSAVILLDGATERKRRTRSGGWIAEQAGLRLQSALRGEPGCDLVDLVRAVIEDLIETYSLVPGDAPSTTVAILRVHADLVETLVIADSPIIIRRTDGELIEITDDRLAELTTALPRPPGLSSTTDPARAERHRAIEAHRNQPGGFWTITASPEAADEAVTHALPLDEFDAALLMSDGVSVLKEEYESDGWGPSFDSYVASPQAAIDRTTALERSDPDGIRWPRGKRHDDKAIASVRPRRRDGAGGG